ncbi:hypothetical protein BDZ97DRAFT_1784648 [Flammula alnicola]|nr:hypothetical protein BDZ97DRAFT_1784648 [Flammula alnicola]
MYQPQNQNQPYQQQQQQQNFDFSAMSQLSERAAAFVQPHINPRFMSSFGLPPGLRLHAPQVERYSASALLPLLDGYEWYGWENEHEYECCWGWCTSSTSSSTTPGCSVPSESTTSNSHSNFTPSWPTGDWAVPVVRATIDARTSTSSGPAPSSGSGSGSSTAAAGPPPSGGETQT